MDVEDDGQPEGPRDPAVAAALDRLRARDADAAEAAAAAWGWVAPDGDAARVHQRFVQDFVWYRLPVKWWTDRDEHLEIAAGLAGLFDELGMGRYAELCRSATTRTVIGAWHRDEKAGLAAYRKAVDSSGIDAPDTEVLVWGEVMTPEESDARDHVAITLERAIADGLLVPGGRGWRAQHRELTVAALSEQVPGHPGRQDWLGLVTTARMMRWIEQRRSPRRRELIGRWEAELLHPIHPPDEVARVVAPLRWLLAQAANGGVALTSQHNLSRLVVQAMSVAFGWWDTRRGTAPMREDDVLEVAVVHELAREQRWVRRQGRTLQATRTGAVVAADDVVAWRALAAAIAAPGGFEGFARECALLVLLDAEQVGRRELLVGLAELAAEAGWHDRMSGRGPTPEELGASVFPLLTVLETFGLHVERDVPREGRFDRLTDAGRATALEALRVRATGPQHRLLD
ncbi:MAG: hypothetical protein EA340_00445 [Nitriliruptor sp.]|nr:MAG: hypothetical protein EA340_00445 [Nitriliruptor sp.]